MPKIPNKPSEEQLRQWFLVDGKTTDEVAQMIGVARQTVWLWKKQFDIPVGVRVPFIYGDLFYRFYALGETQQEIGKHFGVSQQVISYWMRKWDISITDEDERNKITCPVELTELQSDMIRGMMFGDAHIKPYSGSGSGRNSYWIVEHGDYQSFYIHHIYDNLVNYAACAPRRYWRTDGRYKSGGRWATLVRTRAHRFWTELCDVWYPRGVKIVPESELSYLNERSLAYLYADDGSKCGMASNIHTLSFTRAENELISEHLKFKFNLDSQIKKFSGRDQYYIHFDRKNTQTLMEIVSPYLGGLEDIRRKLVPVTRARV
jgi:hypothetical protein